MTVVLKAIFHEKTRVILLSFIGAKDDESSGAVSPAKLLSSCHHQQTNTQLFTGHLPFVSPDQQLRQVTIHCSTVIIGTTLNGPTHFPIVDEESRRPSKCHLVVCIQKGKSSITFEGLRERTE